MRLCSKGSNALGNTAGSLQERQGTGGVLRRRLAGRLLLRCGCKHMSNSTFPQCPLSSMPTFLQHADDLGSRVKLTCSPPCLMSLPAHIQQGNRVAVQQHDGLRGCQTENCQPDRCCCVKAAERVASAKEPALCQALCCHVGSFRLPGTMSFRATPVLRMAQGGGSEQLSHTWCRASRLQQCTTPRTCRTLTR